MPDFIEIEETFCGRTDGHLRPTLLGRLGGVDLIKDRKKHVAMTGKRLSLLKSRIIGPNVPIQSVFESADSSSY